MRFADSFHKRIYNISKFNTVFKKDKEKNQYEVSCLNLNTYVIYSLDFGDRFGYVVENKISGSSILRKMVREEPATYENDISFENLAWYVEFKKMEDSLKDLLKEVEDHESKLLSVANDISKRIAK